MIDDIKRKLRHFFPGRIYSDDSVEQGIAEGKILIGKEAILPSLQTAFFDDKIFEVQLDGQQNVFFSRLKDDVPEQPEIMADDGETNPEYIQGSYLTALSHIIILPVEPGLGNLVLRGSRYIVLRMFTSTMAIELATTFEELTKVEELPVLRLAFPEIARIVPNARAYRAKVPESLAFEMAVELEDNDELLTTTPLNISITGVACSVSKKEQKLFKVNNVHAIKFYLDDELLLRLGGTVRQLSKIRKKFGIEYIFGIDFDIETKTHAAVIESIVATVQRAHLKELAEKSHASGINLIP